MYAAIQAVKDGMGPNRAAELHGVPKTTLKGQSKWSCCTWFKARAKNLFD